MPSRHASPEALGARLLSWVPIEFTIPSMLLSALMCFLGTQALASLMALAGNVNKMTLADTLQDHMWTPLAVTTAALIETLTFTGSLLVARRVFSDMEVAACMSILPASALAAAVSPAWSAASVAAVTWFAHCHWRLWRSGTSPSAILVYLACVRVTSGMLAETFNP